VLGSAVLAGQGTGPVDARVRLAIQDAVAERLGPGAVVTADVTDARVGEVPDGIVAWPDQGARAGALGRFTLFASGSRRIRVGEATARVSASVQTVRLRRAVTRGQVVGPDDIEQVRQEHEGPLLRTPLVDDVVGVQARRDLAAGATLSLSDLTPEQAIRSGESVRAVVRIAGVEVSTTAIALQTGAKHEVIRLTNPGSRKALLGRVTRRGEVEVIDAY
jgi:flagella basal body P-ring formation protein FlgA